MAWNLALGSRAQNCIVCAAVRKIIHDAVPALRAPKPSHECLVIKPEPAAALAMFLLVAEGVNECVYVWGRSFEAWMAAWLLCNVK